MKTRRPAEWTRELMAAAQSAAARWRPRRDRRPAGVVSQRPRQKPGRCSDRDPDVASCTKGPDGKRCRFYVPLEVVPAAAGRSRPDRLSRRPSPALRRPAEPVHPDATATRDGWTRHLCFHVYPVDNGVWRECVTELLPYLPLFNGRRLVAVMTEEPNAARRLDPPGEVESSFAGRGCEFLRIRNQTAGEVVSWVPLLAMVEHLAGPTQALFWTHSKGVTHPEAAAPAWWRRAMLETSLSDWPFVREVLTHHPIAGSFFAADLTRRTPRGRRSGWPWHYSGSMYWLRLDALFAAERWRRPQKRYGGVEFMPGRLFPVSQAGKLFHPLDGPPALYDPNYWQSHVWPALTAWRAAHTPNHVSTPSLSHA